MKHFIYFSILLILFACQKTDSITRFSEESKLEKEYYVYPSTLRMINLEQKKEFDELIEDFELAKGFRIDNSDENIQHLTQLKNEMQDEGYEEAMSLRQKGRDVKVFLLEGKEPQMAIIMEQDSLSDIIHIEGRINLLKLPGLLQDFNESEFLDVLDVIKFDQNKQRHEHHSQNK